MKKFRVFKIPRPVGDDVSGFARRALPDFNGVRDQPVDGWANGSHLAGRGISHETCIVAPWFKMNLVQMERKIPGPLLRSEILSEEAIRTKIHGGDWLSRAEKTEIRQEIVDRLLPTMPVSLSGIAFSGRPDDSRLYVEALSERQVDVFVSYFREATGLVPIAWSADTLLRLWGTDFREWPEMSFSRLVDSERTTHCAGCDFLTWLWYKAESCPDCVPCGPKHGSIGVMLEGPLTLVMEGGGTHVTRLSRGNPVCSAEAKACLQAGKKLKQAEVSEVSK
jgi:hypothetical protein